MPKTDIVSVVSRDEPGHRVAEVILEVAGRVPGTDEHKSRDPAKRARVIANSAAARAAMTAGSLALPPGPLGWLTILPELVVVWRIQAQMVSDIAGIYGKKTYLGREQMLYCLFRHTAAQAARDLIVRVGERYLVQRVSLRTLQSVAERVGMRVTQQAIGKGISRWLPVIGVLGVGAYAYYDTGQVARTAVELFRREIEVEFRP